MEWNNAMAGMPRMTVATAEVAGDADATQNHHSIREAAKLFVSNQMHGSHGALPKTKAGRLESHLRLSTGKESKNVFSPVEVPGLENTTVNKRRPSAGPWVLYSTAKKMPMRSFRSVCLIIFSG